MEDEPVVCYKVEGSLLFYHPLSEPTAVNTIRLDDSLIDLNPVPLGFLPVPEGAVHSSSYVKRGPYRQWKIGLTMHNCISSSAYFEAPGILSPHAFLYSNMMRNLVKGYYPDPKKSQIMSEQLGAVIPFGRRFAVVKDHLLFKDLGEPVGTVTKGKARLHEDFTYLTRMLNEDLNACGNC